MSPINQTGEETLSTSQSDFAIDTSVQTLSTAAAGYWQKLKGGDLGSVPAALGIFVLCLFFGATRPKTFLSVYNFGNLLQQAGPIIAIAVAVSFVLLLGEIDLAAGFSAGVCAAVVATRLKAGWSLPLALLLGILATLVIGLFTGWLVAKIGIPSFVVTLANFLMWQGVVLLITKESGTVRVTDKLIVALDNKNMSVPISWVLFTLVVGGFALASLVSASARRRSGVSTAPVAVIALRTGGLAVLWGIPTLLFSRNRSPNANISIKGVPWVVLVVLILVVTLTFLLTRTAWGRHLYAVGGNAEAARRAGINVARIRMSAFVMCAVLSGVAGVLLASRLNSVDPQTGGNDFLLVAVGAAVIGGTSLFGGRGRIVNAVLGGLVLAIIDNGLPLVGELSIFGAFKVNFSESGIKFIVKGLILLIAASVDALSRKTTASS